MDLGRPINKVLQYDNRERISELESIINVFLHIHIYITQITNILNQNDNWIFPIDCCPPRKLQNTT